jgi:hypothetical protein
MPPGFPSLCGVRDCIGAIPHCFVERDESVSAGLHACTPTTPAATPLEDRPSVRTRGDEKRDARSGTAHEKSRPPDQGSEHQTRDKRDDERRDPTLRVLTAEERAVTGFSAEVTDHSTSL